MNVVNELVVLPSDVWPGLPYNVQVHTSVDGGENFYYCGNGRYCSDLTEAFEYYRSWTDPYYEVVFYRDHRYPNTEIVTEIPDGFEKDILARDRPIHGEWIENWRTGERKILYVA